MLRKSPQAGSRSARGSRELLPLAEATDRIRPFAFHYDGIRPISLRQIVGTDSRSGDFDRDFRPLRAGVRARLEQVERAFPEADFPPITVAQLGDAYFVVDGHHRVAIARRRRMETIDAEVTRMQARWPLAADADAVELIHAEQHRLFMTRSGLADARPNAPLRFSRPVGYLELLETVQIHGYHLMLEAQRPLTPAAIAADWYSRVYEPAVEAIRAEQLDEVCPEATEADRFLWMHQQRRAFVPEHGSQPLEEVVRRATRELARERRGVRRLVRRTA